MTKLMLRIDISGVQDFIYTISSSLLRREANGDTAFLKARSNFLSNKTNEWAKKFAELGSSRGITGEIDYVGGGGAYIFYSASEQSKIEELKSEIKKLADEINNKLIEQFGIKLYLAVGYSEFEGDKPEKTKYREVSNLVSECKAHRYGLDQIMKLNSGNNAGRECKICLSQNDVNADSEICKVCTELKNSVDNKIRGLEGLAKKSIGIKRCGVLRLDVDDLGAQFISCPLDRTKHLSKHFEEFFKEDKLREMFKNPQESFLKNSADSDENQNDRSNKKRNCEVIYAGGDDVFVVGAWNDVIEFAIDLRKDFNNASKGWTADIFANDPQKSSKPLTLSAGIGMFQSNLPVSQMAKHTGELEEAAKANENKENKKQKDSVALFDERFVFFWDEFIDEVIGKKYKEIAGFFTHFNKAKDDQYGKAFIYKLLGLLRETNIEQTNQKNHKTISMAHWVYFLTRMEPKSNNQDEKSRFEKFSKSLGSWIENKKDRKQLECALELYVYTRRESDKKLNKEEKNGE